MPMRLRNSNSNTNIKNLKPFQQVDNTYDDYFSDFTTGWISESNGSSAFSTISDDDLEKWLSNPNSYYTEIINLMKYLAISDSNIYQLYQILTSLPTLNYKVHTINVEKKTKDKDINLINNALVKVRYKQLSRELLMQANTEGTVVAMWLGSKNEPYLHIFSNLKYIFPAFRRKGEWVCVCDMSWFDNMQEAERMYIFEELSPYITENDYNNYKKNQDEFQYKELDAKRTCVIRFNTTSRNQRLGIPSGTQVIKGIRHKQVLKDLDESISANVIDKIPVLQIGNTEKPNETIPKKVRRQIGSSVFKVLQGSKNDGKLGLITIPEYCNLSFLESASDEMDGLDEAKYQTVNNDISSGLGISSALLSGSGNGSVVKYNLETLYRKIASQLDELDIVFQKFLNLVLGANANNYVFEFEKDTPLSNKEKLDVLTKLHAEGFSVKAIIDMVSGIDFESYVKQSMIEQESNMYDIIKPPLTSYTATSSDLTDDTSGGREKIEDPDNEETIRTQEKSIAEGGE